MTVQHVWARFGIAAVTLALTSTSLLAQPLVEGNLTLYYDFDEIVVNADGEKEFVDKSGNNLNGTIHEGDPDVDLAPGTLTVDTTNARRGAGAAHFQQSEEGELDAPVYVDVHGKEITENHPLLLPTSGLNDEFGLTIAAWLNVPANDAGDQSVFQARTSNGGHGAPHFQLQGNGKFRMTFRDQAGTDVVNAQYFTDGVTDGGEPYPVDEWFHYAGVYDADEGTWWMYFNGELIAEGTPAGGSFDLGDWGGQEEEQGNLFAAGFGAVYDSGGRRLNGLMDELYVFNRALSADEIMTLTSIPDIVNLVGDCNGDGVLNASDLACITDVAQRDAVLATLNTLPGDLDGNGDVAFADFLILSANFGAEGQGYSAGNIDLAGGVDFADFLVLSANFGAVAGAATAAVPEPSCGLLLLVGACAFGIVRRRR